MSPDDTEAHSSVDIDNPIINGILNGDLPPNTSIALIGAPGTGTSTMAVQFVMNSLRKGRKILFVLYDYVAKLASKYFRSFGFDPEPFITGGKLQIINGYDLLRIAMRIPTMTDFTKLRPLTFDELSKVFQAGLASKIPDNELEPSSIVVDSFTALSPFIDVHTVYEILAEGFARIRAGRHPCLIVAHDGVLESNFVQALTRFVDGVIRLKIEWSNRGFTRELFIEKLRFTNVKTPLIDFAISDHGISLLPMSLQPGKELLGDFAGLRISGTENSSRQGVERTSTGVPELDIVLMGGFPKGTFVCVEGDVGTGTSTLCTQFAWSRLLAGGKVSYYCIDDPPNTIIDQFNSFGWDIRPYVDRGDIILSDAHSLFRAGRRETTNGAREPESTRNRISDFIKEEEAKMSASVAKGLPRTAVIDSFTTMAPYLDLKTAYVLARAIADDARESDEIRLTVVRSGTVEANLLYACLGTSDGILKLENVWIKAKHGPSVERKLSRRMRIEKMAFTPVPPHPLEYEITSKGIRLSNFKEQDIDTSK